MEENMKYQNTSCEFTYIISVIVSIWYTHLSVCVYYCQIHTLYTLWYVHLSVYMCVTVRSHGKWFLCHYVHKMFETYSWSVCVLSKFRHTTLMIKGPSRVMVWGPEMKEVLERNFQNSMKINLVNNTLREVKELMLKNYNYFVQKSF